MTLVEKGWYPPQEQSPHAAIDRNERRSGAPSGDFHSKSQLKRVAAQMKVTPEEEDAWIEKLNRMAGCAE